MTHLSDDRLILMAEQTAEPAAHEQDHLDACALCRTRLAETATLLDDLALMAAAEPGAGALARYYALFDQVARPQTRAGTRLQAALNAVRLALTWDSRTRPAFSGVRSTGEGGYRLLFEAGPLADAAGTPAEEQVAEPDVEIELLVTADGAKRRIVGELSAHAPVAVMTVTLMTAEGEEMLVHRAAEEGRFQLPPVETGRYRMVLDTGHRRLYETDELDLT